ncbi:hypothetical protein LY78DRAFT_131463 [Colletotrichum sublineola]|nr:hypothetical protein LY78DRAFT_131463 [Colletotrichum sublineola]
MCSGSSSWINGAVCRIPSLDEGPEALPSLCPREAGVFCTLSLRATFAGRGWGKTTYAHPSNRSNPPECRWTTRNRLACIFHIVKAAQQRAKRSSLPPLFFGQRRGGERCKESERPFLPPLGHGPKDSVAPHHARDDWWPGLAFVGSKRSAVPLGCMSGGQVCCPFLSEMQDIISPFKPIAAVAASG